jgi:hypothetical protein
MTTVNNLASLFDRPSHLISIASVYTLIFLFCRRHYGLFTLSPFLFPPPLFGLLRIHLSQSVLIPFPCCFMVGCIWCRVDTIHLTAYEKWNWRFFGLSLYLKLY